MALIRSVCTGDRASLIERVESDLVLLVDDAKLFLLAPDGESQVLYPDKVSRYQEGEVGGGIPPQG
jgi:hypothetical protein